MARLARIVIPGIPHHVTQRGNGRQTFSNICHPPQTLRTQSIAVLIAPPGAGKTTAIARAAAERMAGGSAKDAGGCGSAGILT
jgi:flagellar biosynthesis GTPase FlhF